LKTGSKAKAVDLARTAVKLSELIGRDSCLLIGGLAVGAHGYVRATDDLDFITSLRLSEVEERLREAVTDLRYLRGDVLDGGFNCLKGKLDGVPFDVMPPLVPLDWSRSTEIVLGAGRLRVVDLEALIALKMRAQGPQDLMDAAMLVLFHPEARDRARELALAYGVADKFDIWLGDKRLANQAREKADTERPQADKPKRKPRRRR
jgi:hypothetical protein